MGGMEGPDGAMHPNLPPAQRELLMRIQKQQRDNTSEDGGETFGDKDERQGRGTPGESAVSPLVVGKMGSQILNVHDSVT